MSPQSACALTEIKWVSTTNGFKTVRELLLDAHNIEGLDPEWSAIEFGSAIRFLTSVTALVERAGGNEDRYTEENVDAALVQLVHATDVFHPTIPFLQKDYSAEFPTPPPLNPRKKVDSGNKVSLLYPSFLGAETGAFWSRKVASDRMTLEQAVLGFLVFHNYSLAANTWMNGWKVVNGSPASRWPETGFTSTEFYAGGDNMHEVLRRNTVRAHVKGAGLPGWADLHLEKSYKKGLEHPLWRATWSTNTVVATWDGTDLVAIARAGRSHLPKTMEVPNLKGDKTPGGGEPKKWWDDRDAEDVFYLRQPSYENKLGKLIEPKAPVSIPINSHESEILAAWHSEGHGQRLIAQRSKFVDPGSIYSPIIIARHLTGGQAGGPSVRHLSLTTHDPRTWVAAEHRVDAVIAASELLNKAHARLVGPFHPKMGRLRDVSNLKPALSDLFWSKTSRAFQDFVIRGVGALVSQEVWRYSLQVALESYDEITESIGYSQLEVPLIVSRNSIESGIRNMYKLHEVLTPIEIEKKAEVA